MELGRHVIAEFRRCRAERFSDPQFIESVLIEAARAAKLNVITSKTHHFSPGTTSFVVISESHLSIHTWPEYSYAAVDIFVCGGRDPWPALEVIRERLKPEGVSVIEIKRGILG